jgi:hypothetical protein
MKKSEIQVGGRYVAKVSGKRVIIRLVKESEHGGWEALNESTGRAINIKTGGRLTPVPVKKIAM